jgi:hypothetical protein
MPLFYQPEPHGQAESDAYDALLAAGYAIRCRHGLITGSGHGHYRAERGAYRTRSHRSIRAAWAQAQADADRPASRAPLAP